MQRSELEILLAVVDHGSFSAAARMLGYTPSAVGKRVHLLEKRLRVPLLIRSTRRMSLTEAGQRYVGEARDILARMTALEEGIAEDDGRLRGVVRMTCSAALGRRLVVPLVNDFMSLHPDLEIELLMTDKLVDLVGEGFDIAIRSGTLTDSTLISRKIAENRRVICAAPKYTEVHGAPQNPKELADHRCLRLKQEKLVADWGMANGDSHHARLGPGMTCNSLEALQSACLHGVGIAWLPEFLIERDLNEGNLIPVLSEFTDSTAGGGVFVLRPETSFLPRRVRLLVEHLAAGFGRN
ncbi:LysR family transcriptional regulator [Aliiroseovarius sp. S253]|uniref:LysR family transcriptional regulator n=1 Tax=Aliiroseovarius sp. S253 TaxID=3415133 RepID=UPI003C7BB8EC